MLSWRGGAGVGGLGPDIPLLPGDGGITRGASSLAAARQQVMKVRERRRRHPWRTELHPRAGHGVQHPGRHHRDHAGGGLDMDDLTGGAPLAVPTKNALPIERMPAVVNDSLLPDMGRMTPRWPWGARMPCSPAATCWRHNAAVHGRQADWVRISHRGHADLGQVVRVVRRMTRDGAVTLVVKLPDGRSERVPLSWTETAPDGPTMPVLLFSPSSLRALVRLVREHGIPPSAETDHGGRGIPDLEAPARRRSRRGGGAVGGTPAPPAGRPPGEEHGGEP